jgi:hypothetical protein
MEASNCSRILEEEVTEIACETMEDHSESEGGCFGGATPSFSDVSTMFSEDAMARGISFL